MVLSGGGVQNSMPEFRIEEEASNFVNECSDNSVALASARRVLDDCQRDGARLVVTDERDHEIGRVTERIGERYVRRGCQTTDACDDAPIAVGGTRRVAVNAISRW